MFKRSGICFVSVVSSILIALFLLIEHTCSILFGTPDLHMYLPIFLPAFSLVATKFEKILHHNHQH